MREAEEGGVIVIERRGQPVAELRPVAARPPISQAEKEQIFREMQPIWDSMPQVSDSTPSISEDRDR